MAARVLVVIEHDGRTEVYADPDVKVYKVEPWNPDEYDEGTVEEQVQRTVPYVYEELYRKDRHKKTATPRPYQRVIPIEEMSWWDILIALFVAMENRALARGRPNPELLQHLNHICDNPSEYGFWAQLFAPDLIEEVKQLRARRVL